jgi:hypothetical protein
MLPFVLPKQDGLTELANVAFNVAGCVMFIEIEVLQEF